MEPPTVELPVEPFVLAPIELPDDAPPIDPDLLPLLRPLPDRPLWDEEDEVELPVPPIIDPWLAPALLPVLECEPEDGVVVGELDCIDPPIEPEAPPEAPPACAIAAAGKRRAAAVVNTIRI